MAAQFARDYVSAGRRDFRATPKVAGSFTKGNRNSTYLGREATRGLLATVANPANPKPRQYWRPKVSDDASTPPKRGRICPACGIERSVSNRCDCNS